MIFNLIIFWFWSWKKEQIAKLEVEALEAFIKKKKMCKQWLSRCGQHLATTWWRVRHIRFSGACLKTWWLREGLFTTTWWTIYHDVVTWFWKLIYLIIMSKSKGELLLSATLDDQKPLSNPKKAKDWLKNKIQIDPKKIDDDSFSLLDFNMFTLVFSMLFHFSDLVMG